MKRSLILALFSTACIIAYGANKSVIKNNVNGGDAETKFISEECCVKSEEVYKNLAEAAKLYRAAAEQGNVGGQCNLGLYYIQEKRDNVRGYAWILLSVKNGLEDLTSKLAELEKQMDKGEIERAKKLAGKYSKGNFDK